MSTLGTPQQIIVDLEAIFDRFPTECLAHLRENQHRLVRSVYRTSDGRGCIMHLLSELLPDHQRIDSRDALKRFFGRPVDGRYDVDNDPAYQPARWIVRIWDMEPHPERYGTAEPLSEQVVMKVLNGVIARRQADTASSRSVNDPPAQDRRKVRAFDQSGRYRAGCEARCAQS